MLFNKMFNRGISQMTLKYNFIYKNQKIKYKVLYKLN